MKGILVKAPALSLLKPSSQRRYENAAPPRSQPSPTSIILLPKAIEEENGDHERGLPCDGDVLDDANFVPFGIKIYILQESCSVEQSLLASTGSEGVVLG